MKPMVPSAEEQKWADTEAAKIVGNRETIATMLLAARHTARESGHAAGFAKALEMAAGAMCFGCKYGWEVGEVSGIGEGYPYPIHKDPQTGNYGHPCSAAAIRALATTTASR